MLLMVVFEQLVRHRCQCCVWVSGRRKRGHENVVLTEKA